MGIMAGVELDNDLENAADAELGDFLLARPTHVAGYLISRLKKEYPDFRCRDCMSALEFGDEPEARHQFTI